MYKYTRVTVKFHLVYYQNIAERFPGTIYFYRNRREKDRQKGRERGGEMFYSYTVHAFFYYLVISNRVYKNNKHFFFFISEVPISVIGI